MSIQTVHPVCSLFNLLNCLIISDVSEFVAPSGRGVAETLSCLTQARLPSSSFACAFSCVKIWWPRIIMVMQFQMPICRRTLNPTFQEFELPLATMKEMLWANNHIPLEARACDPIQVDMPLVLHPPVPPFSIEEQLNNAPVRPTVTISCSPGCLANVSWRPIPLEENNLHYAILAVILTRPSLLNKTPTQMLLNFTPDDVAQEQNLLASVLPLCSKSKQFHVITCTLAQ
ncbi:hypothetical protein BJV77DRAFT_963266 [Russula vinacea]|nr:hypothetical protein BJV77DRAFT_963266 [Russula vinacea]